MRATYDPKADAAYIYLREGTSHQTIHVSDDVHIDLDAQGAIIGIELLSLSTHADKPQEMTFELI
jgi:uncharacterized protein YuzE